MSRKMNDKKIGKSDKWSGLDGKGAFSIIPPALVPFLDEPTREFNVRELARLLRISPTTASAHLRRYAGAGILREARNRNLRLYRANLESAHCRDIKVFRTVRKLRDSGLMDALDGFYLSPTVILFGSASTGYDTGASDIDLVIVSDTSKAFPRQPEFERKLGRDLQIFAVKALKDLKNEHLIANAIDGITLQGGKTWNSMNASLRGRLLRPPRFSGVD